MEITTDWVWDDLGKLCIRGRGETLATLLRKTRMVKHSHCSTHICSLKSYNRNFSQLYYFYKDALEYVAFYRTDSSLFLLKIKASLHDYWHTSNVYILNTKSPLPCCWNLFKDRLTFAWSISRRFYFDCH